MAEPQKIALTLPSSLEYLDLLQGMAEQLAYVVGFDEEARLDVGLAVREGAINAMKHGNGLDPAVDIGIEFVTTDSQLKIVIVDNGEGFEPAETPDPTAPENIWRSSGRGLLLIRSLVDEVSFKRRKRGMKLELAKDLPRPEAGEEAS